MSLPQMRKAAADAGFDIHFDWEAARSVEGYYRIKGSTEFCIQRAIAWTPYADAIWMETGKPILAQATQFAQEVRAAAPHQMLAYSQYNNSPSFNWDQSGMTEAQMESFIFDLAKLGYCWQFITLAGFHSLNYGMFDLAHGYAREGMTAFVDLQEREFKAAEERGFTAVKHQREVGAGYFDTIATTVDPASSILPVYAKATIFSSARPSTEEPAAPPPTRCSPASPLRTARAGAARPRPG